MHEQAGAELYQGELNLSFPPDGESWLRHHFKLALKLTILYMEISYIALLQIK